MDPAQQVKEAVAAAVLVLRRSSPSLTEADAYSLLRNHFQAAAAPASAEPVYANTADLVRMSQPVAEPKPESRTCCWLCDLVAPWLCRSCGGQGRTSAAAAPRSGGRIYATPDAATISRMRSLPVEEKDRRLIQAAQDGAVEEMRALMRAGANMGARDRGEMTALHWAATMGHEDVVKCLVWSGVEIDASDWKQNTPLHWAALYGHASVVQLLLAASADPNVTDRWGTTPLHDAARMGQAEVAAVLLKAGADKYATDFKGDTPLDHARQNNKHKLVEMLS